MDKIPVAILGATGMVGQRFITLLANHPWFEVSAVAASENSAGKTYAEAVAGRWVMTDSIPSSVAEMTVLDNRNVYHISRTLGLVFSAFKAQTDETRQLEESYARQEVMVVSANSAHRWTPDVPMIIPEVNPEHLEIIPAQRTRLGTWRGCIVVKPNCSLQSFVPPIHVLKDLDPLQIYVSTYQAVSGAGKTLTNWPEMKDNAIPYIKGEEEKTTQEPLKIWGTIHGKEIVSNYNPIIDANCVRVDTSDGHLITVGVSFGPHRKCRTQETIVDRWSNARPKPQLLGLPSAPVPYIYYHHDDDRPQTKLDRDLGNGMTISVGRLRPSRIFDYQFVCLSHNTIRGAAGGAILTAELLKADGYLE